jgi:hypothetical protein
LGTARNGIVFNRGATVEDCTIKNFITDEGFLAALAAVQNGRCDLASTPT